MRHSQFTDQEILHLLLEANAGVPVAEICRTAQVSLRTFYRWRQRFGGLTPQAIQEMKDLQAENRRLRTLVSSLTARLNGTDPEASATTHARPPGEFASSSNRAHLLASRPREGVALGRFASVRVGR